MIVFWPWSADARAVQTLRDLRRDSSPTTEVMILDRERGFADALNQAVERSGRADLAVVADACALPTGWLERLRSAAYADDAAGGATALTSGYEKPMFQGADGDPVYLASTHPPAGGASDDPVHPRISSLWPQCAYIRRTALDLLGPLSLSLTHPQAVLAEFSARALSHGLWFTLADNVAVQRLAGGLPSCPPAELMQVTERYPGIEAVRTEEDALELGPLRRSLVAARVAGRELTVTIDARALGPTSAGTQTYVEGLLLALVRSGRGRVRAVVRDDAPRPTIEQLERAGVDVLAESLAAARPTRTDVAHRPQQVFVPEDLSLLRRVGERVVISHLDLIAYRSPAYHPSTDEWRRYRRLTRLALGAADRVVFLSEHARGDAIAEDLVESGYTAVAGVGIEPEAIAETARRPDRVPSGRELLVMIGSDYLHKNRLFALELVCELCSHHSWDGLLVLAGAHVPHGGSAGDESELLEARPELAAHVLDLGPIGEDEKRWLLKNSRALLCPSTYEGFGLTPLEAAAAGTACVYAATTSLDEVVGSEAATIVPWDAAASAERALPLLREGEPRRRHIASLQSALSRYEWDSIVADLHAVYRDAVRSPYRSSVPRAWEDLEREQLIVLLDRGYHDLRERVEHGLPLIDRGGLLTRAQQRGLMRIASRRWLRGPLLGPVGRLGSMRPEDRGPSPP